jgi:hypothetical protein
MTLVDPSCGQLLLGLLNGLSPLLTSCLFSSSHTSRAVAEFHVTDFRHDYFISVVYFLPRQVKVLTLARRASRNASSKEAAVFGVASLEF